MPAATNPANETSSPTKAETEPTEAKNSHPLNGTPPGASQTVAPLAAASGAPAPPPPLAAGPVGESDEKLDMDAFLAEPPQRPRSAPPYPGAGWQPDWDDPPHLVRATAGLHMNG